MSVHDYFDVLEGLKNNANVSREPIVHHTCRVFFVRTGNIVWAVERRMAFEAAPPPVGPWTPPRRGSAPSVGPSLNACHGAKFRPTTLPLPRAYSVYRSKTRQALVPPKPNELDMTRSGVMSSRLVRMFMPSASSTSSLMLALSARKPFCIISMQ